MVTLPSLKKSAQRYVNKFVRLRDQGQPCISCQKFIVKNGQAGHYIAQGASGALRYNLNNINLQCGLCNLYLHGNLIGYRIGLVKKIGEKEVERLENRRHEIKKWTRDELLEIISKTKEAIEELYGRQ